MNKKYPVREDMILVALDSNYVYIPKEVFVALFENSHIYYKSDYKKALADSRIRFKVLKDLSRDAGIPYSLFFAPLDKVHGQIEANNDILFKGVQDTPMAIASRGDIHLRDINLIIKDIQKRQQFLAKNHRDTEENPIINLRQQQSVPDMARLIISTLDLDMDKFRSHSSKESSYNYLVSHLESKNIIISRSRRGVMPQTIRKELSFSGFSVRHKKYPAIFLHSKDEDMASDPAGRRIFTIFLLLSCIANKRYVMVSYSQSVKEPAQNIEYMLAEEILMPEDAVSSIRVNSIEEVEALAESFKVTPSMTLVRLKRLGCLSEETFDTLFNLLDRKWREATSSSSKGCYVRDANITTKVITYNGQLFTAEIISLLRMGKLGIKDASRLLLFKNRPRTLLSDIGEKI